MSGRQKELDRIAALDRHDLEVEAMEAWDLFNHPEVRSFLDGTRLEIIHQVQRWGTVHDRAKEPSDWFWLVGYLAGKALSAHLRGNTSKALHHTISTAAVLANWHTAIVMGNSEFAPGHSDLQKYLQDTFGPELTGKDW